MNKVALLSTDDRRHLFQEASFTLGMTPAIVEKDFWVTWVLNRLFSNETLANQRLMLICWGYATAAPQPTLLHYFFE